MLDKETKQAIKSMQRFVECKQDMSVVTANEMKIILQYIEQLETDKQKLIEKLEEDIEIARKEYRITLSDSQDGIRAEAQEILSIVKGEKDE